MFIGYLLYIKRRRTNNEFQPLQDKDGLLQRRLGVFERFFVKTSGGTIISVLLISSKVPLSTRIAYRALCLINQRFPLLRMRIFKKGNSLWFKEMTNSSKIAFNICKEYTANQWTPVLEKESCIPLDLYMGPLWRVTLLKEEYDNTLDEYINCFVLTINHSICDGTSRMAFFTQLLEYINNLHLGKDVQVESLPFLPPSSFLMESKVQPTCLQRMQSTLSTALRKVKHTIVRSSPEINVFLNVYPPAIMQDPYIFKRTSIISTVITARELAMVVQMGKEHGCTVHSIITAACRLAMARILKKGSLIKSQEPLKFISSFNVATRRYCEPIVSLNQVGCFISSIIMNNPTPSTRSLNYDLFWDYTKKCHGVIKDKIGQGEHYQMERFVRVADFTSPLLSHSNRYTSVFNISNLGKFTIDNGFDKDAVFHCKGMYCASDEQDVGTLFGHNIVTVDGELYWSLFFFPHITTKKQAEELLSLTLDILRQGCAL